MYRKALPSMVERPGIRHDRTRTANRRDRQRRRQRTRRRASVALITTTSTYFLLPLLQPVALSRSRAPNSIRDHRGRQRSVDRTRRVTVAWRRRHEQSPLRRRPVRFAYLRWSSCWRRAGAARSKAATTNASSDSKRPNSPSGSTAKFIQVV